MMPEISKCVGGNVYPSTIWMSYVRIVMQNHDIILGDTHIAFNFVNVVFEGFFERGDCIFGCEAAGAAVANYFHYS